MKEINKLRFPIPDEKGWEFDYKFLETITDKVRNGGEDVTTEQVQAVLIALTTIDNY